MIARPLALLTAGALAAGGGLLALGEDAPASTAAPPAMTGAALFQAKGCATCHTGPTSTSNLGAAPELDDLAVTAADRIDGVAIEDYVRRSIIDPQAFIAPGAGYVEMPTLPVTPEELDLLVAYLVGTST